MKEYDIEFAIIGAGFAGIIAAMQLAKKSYSDYTIFERASSVGGTWRDNTYPGCACDVSSYLYSIKEAPNPNWTKMYSSQAEILTYLKDVVTKNDIENHIVYDTEILEMQFDSNEAIWHLKDQNNKVYKAKFVLMAQGPLNRAVIPNFKGLDLFKGKYFHTSNWDHSCDLKNKKVAIIGTGASAIQVIPNIADQVNKLHVIQRTAAWILPRANPEIGATTKKMYSLFPFLEKMRREYIYWTNEFFGLAFIGNKFVNRIASNFALSYLKRKVTDETLRKKLTPTYTFGCKRVLLSKTYYPTFNKQQVSLHSTTISEIKEHSIILENKEKLEVDVIIMATGFEAAELQVHTKILGVDGRNLIDRWKEEGVSAYKGCITHDVPNLFFILGPNTGLGHNSVLHMMESQMYYILDYIKQSKKLPSKSYLNLKLQVEEAYNKKLQSDLIGTVWNSGCKSWYLNSRGVNTTIYPRLNNRFRKEMKSFDLKSFECISIN